MLHHSLLQASSPRAFSAIYMFSYLIPASASQRLRDIEALLEHVPQYQAREAAWRLERVVQWHD
jgi:hypothetical protein